MKLDREEMIRRLGVVTAYRTSGLRAARWASDNGMAMRVIAAWCAHAKRWQARLEGARVQAQPPVKRKAAFALCPAYLPPMGFVAARVASCPPNGAAVRIELHAGASRFDLHWPLDRTLELAALVRALQA